MLLALAFDYINGFHDTANAIATSVSTRAISPKKAVMMTAVLNFVGALVSTGVAKTIGGDLVMSANLINAEVISAALLGAIVWNLVTWWYGIPSSSSHAHIADYCHDFRLYYHAHLVVHVRQLFTDCLE